MALYAIGDLHLHFQSELKAEGQRTDPLWRDHERVFRENCSRLLKPRDTLVLVGDHSWGRKLNECEEDLKYIEQLPGRKILLRGNHDMFWDAGKTAKLNALYEGRLNFLQDNFFAYGDIALVGTKGYTFEGPFRVDRRGNVIGWDEREAEHAEQLVEREYDRLKRSFEAAAAAGYSRFIMFLHYPPTNILQTRSCFTDLAEQYGAEQVVYGHCHGARRFRDSLLGRQRGIAYSLVSGDSLRWQPLRLIV